jgi:hypothetical protein
MAPKTCPTCGAEIAADDPQGLCPACLLKEGLPSEVLPAGAGRQCTACGSTLGEGARFCANCAAPVSPAIAVAGKGGGIEGRQHFDGRQRAGGSGADERAAVARPQLHLDLLRVAPYHRPLHHDLAARSVDVDPVEWTAPAAGGGSGGTTGPSPRRRSRRSRPPTVPVWAA